MRWRRKIIPYKGKLFRSSSWKSCFSWDLRRSSQNASQCYLPLPSALVFCRLKIAPNDPFPMFWRPSCCYKDPLCRRSLRAENEVSSAHEGRPCQLKVNLGLRGLHWYHLPRCKESEIIRSIWCGWTTVILGPINQLFNNLVTFCVCVSCSDVSNSWQPQGL